MDVASKEVWKDNPNVEEVDEDLGKVYIPKNPMESFEVEIEEDFGEENLEGAEAKYQAYTDDTNAEKVAEKLEDKVVDKVSDNVADKVTDDVTKKVTDNLSEQMQNNAMLQVEMLKAQTEQQRVQLQAANLQLTNQRHNDMMGYFIEERAKREERQEQMRIEQKKDDRKKGVKSFFGSVGSMIKAVIFLVVIIFLLVVIMNPRVHATTKTLLNHLFDFGSAVVSGEADVDSNELVDDTLNSLGKSLNDMNTKVIIIEDESEAE